MVTIIRKSRIRTRFIILFLISSLLPILSIGPFMYRQASKKLYYNTSQTVQSTNENTASYISEKMRKVISDSAEIANSDIVQNLLKDSGNYDFVRIYEAQKNIQSNMIKKLIYNDVVTEITVFTPEYEKINLYGPYAYRFRPEQYEIEEMISKCTQTDTSCVFLSMNSINSIILMRRIKDKESVQILGYLMMRIDENRICEMLPEYPKAADSRSFLVNEDGRIISSDRKDELDLICKEEALLAILRKNQQGLVDIDDRGMEQMVCLSEIRSTGWRLVTFLPAAFFQLDSRQLYTNLILLILFCVVMAVGISLLVAFSILVPIEKLVMAMENYKNEQSDIYIQDEGKDELACVLQTFNHMTSKMNQLIVDTRCYEKQKRELEIQALQAQVNPHFIANTLNLIAGMAAVNNEQEIEKIANSLVNMLRNCIQRNEQFVSLGYEIQVLQSYIEIQDYRMLGKFTVQMSVDAGILEYQVPHLVLQPIVENAILHGVLPNKKRRGNINIDGFKEEGEIVVTVTDNGVGMDVEQVKKSWLQQQKNRESGRFSSIGIGNVQQRIQMLFGEEYGLSISSMQGKYTTVIIRLPALTKEEAESYV